MSEIVNRTAEVAAQWHQHLVWIRINVAYIKAELPHLLASGHEVSDIEDLLASFASVFEHFCGSEFDLFVAARASEVNDSEKQALIGKLHRTRESFRAWLHDYHGVVQRRRAAGEPSLPLVLLQGCGAELLKAHRCFVEIIEAYVHEIESSSNDPMKHL